MTPIPKNTTPEVAPVEPKVWVILLFIIMVAVFSFNNDIVIESWYIYSSNMRTIPANIPNPFSILVYIMTGSAKNAFWAF